MEVEYWCAASWARVQFSASACQSFTGNNCLQCHKVTHSKETSCQEKMEPGPVVWGQAGQGAREAVEAREEASAWGREATVSAPIAGIGNLIKGVCPAMI